MKTAKVNMKRYHNYYQYPVKDYIDLKITDYFSVMVPNEEGKTEPKLKKPKLLEKRETGTFEPITKELDLFYNRLHDQLLMEILIRLPPECACRYRAVCKRWCSLLSTPYFITRVIDVGRHRYTPLLPAPHTFTLLFQYVIHEFRYCRDKYEFHLEAISNHPVLAKTRELDLDFLPRPSLSDAYYTAKYSDDDTHFMTIMGSCNDLLLCSHHGLYRFYVVNLLTRHWIMLPPSGPENSESFLFVGKQAFAGLVCYHDKSEINSGDGWYKFKVVVFPAYSNYDEDRFFDPELCQFKLRIYCSESNQWTDYVVDWYPFAWTPVDYQLHAPILANDDKLHWLNGCSLVSFDPFIEYGQFLKLRHTIKLPDELVHHKPSCFGLCRGHFRVARRYLDEGGTFFHVWDLEDYDKGVWKLAHKVLLNISDLKYYIDVHSIEYDLCFMAFHPFDEDVVFVRARDVFYQFNLRTGRHERYYEVERLGESEDYWCKAVPPLLHQWFPTAVPSPPPPA